jgi:hypothetical protein
LLIVYVGYKSYAYYITCNEPVLRVSFLAVASAWLSNAANMVANPVSLPGEWGKFEPRLFFLFWILLALFSSLARKPRSKRPSFEQLFF